MVSFFLFILLSAATLTCDGSSQTVRKTQIKHVKKLNLNDEVAQPSSSIRHLQRVDRKNPSLSQIFVDDDWKYNPPSRHLQEADDENGEDVEDNEREEEDNNNADRTGDDDCITEKNYLAELLNHLIFTTPEEWSVTEIILVCCFVSIGFSSVLVTLCCVYGCFTAYCCCCCEDKKRSSNQKYMWEDDTTASGYSLDYKFSHDSSLV